MPNCYFKMSRLKSLVPFIAGFSCMLVGLLGCLGFFISPPKLEFGEFLVACFLIFVMVFCCGFAAFINFIRLFKAPTILEFTPNELIYYYSIFHTGRKKIVLPWDKVVDISLEVVAVVDDKLSLGDDRLKVSCIEIVVEDNFLANYSMFKNNIFLSGNKLSVLCGDLKTITPTVLKETLEQVGVQVRFRI